jgi:hypothetical protein
MNFPNGINLGLYLSGLAAVGYLAYSSTGDVLFAGALVLVARWLKPYPTTV